MNPAFIVRLRPTGPWRFGPASGARDRVDRIYHSDSLFSAISIAFLRLGLLEDWLAATTTSAAAVRLSSCFPFQGETLFVTPPATHWPPAASTRVRWRGARFVPLSLVRDLLAEKTPDEARWSVDGASECVVPPERGRSGPFRTAIRSNAALDRITGDALVHSTACLEFSPDAGLWAAVAFAGEEARDRWAEPVKGAFRLLADSGFGGERSIGWGRSAAPEFADGALPDLLLPALRASEIAETAPEPPPRNWWLLSLFTPSEADRVDWTRGQYAVLVRGGRVESAAEWGAAKKWTRMIAEGSVLTAESSPLGSARNVAPEGFPHAVYRSGVALALPIPAKAVSS
jgi:CRISPR type III-A-associated RAMP protein Csm4